MFRRVEACFPIEPRKLADRVREELEFCLSDNAQAWLLQSDGHYVRATSDAPPFEAQSTLLERWQRN
jgi:polyphosphate kinase